MTEKRMDKPEGLSLSKWWNELDEFEKTSMNIFFRFMLGFIAIVVLGVALTVFVGVDQSHTYKTPVSSVQ